MAAGTGKVAYSNAGAADHKESAGSTWFFTTNAACCDIINNTSVLSLDLRENILRGNFQIGFIGIRVYWNLFTIDHRMGAVRIFREDYDSLRHSRNNNSRDFKAFYKTTNKSEVKAGFSSSKMNFDWGEFTHKSFSDHSVAVNISNVPMLTLNISAAGKKSRAKTPAWARDGEINWVVFDDDFEKELKKRWNPNKNKAPNGVPTQVNDVDHVEPQSPSSLDSQKLWQCTEQIKKNDGNVKDFAPLGLIKSLPKYKQEQRYVTGMKNFVEDMNMTVDGMEMGQPLTKTPMKPADLFDNGGGIVVNAFDNGRQNFNFTQDGWRNFTFGPGTFYWFNRQVDAYIGGRSVKAEDHFLLVRGPALWHFQCLGERVKSETLFDSNGTRERKPEKSVFKQRFEGEMLMESVECYGDKREVKNTHISFSMKPDKESPANKSEFYFKSPIFKFSAPPSNDQKKFMLIFDTTKGEVDFSGENVVFAVKDGITLKSPYFSQTMDHGYIKCKKQLLLMSERYCFN